MADGDGNVVADDSRVDSMCSYCCNTLKVRCIFAGMPFAVQNADGERWEVAASQTFVYFPRSKDSPAGAHVYPGSE